MILEFLKRLFFGKEDLEGKKFLGYFRLEQLKQLEELLGIDLGVNKQRFTRPFIGIYKGDSTFVCFLTSQGRGNKRRIEIGLCNKSGCPKYRFLDYSYLYYDRERKGVYAYEFPREYIKKKSVQCGLCKDLEFLNDLPRTRQ